MLKRSFKLIIKKHRSWHIGRVFWYDWRDPPKTPGLCSFCSSAGLLRRDFTAKPAMGAFVHFTGGRVP
jgi:hypothetical protein